MPRQDQVKPSRTCRKCGHVHPYATPIYRCEGCHEWGQDYYELKYDART